MIQLPKDEPITVNPEPKNFFIYGETMSGKSYFASYFPHPLSLNTDGNAEQGTIPAIQIRNIRDKNGRLTQNAIKQLDDIIVALQSTDHTFETIIIDVIDDICVMIEQAICLENGVQSLADIPYGKGFSAFNTVLQQFVMDLKALPMNVIFISRELIITDENNNEQDRVPSLKTKYYNIVNGNCDLVIHTLKFGKATYRREIKARRAQYTPEAITNPRVKQLLESIPDMFATKQK